MKHSSMFVLFFMSISIANLSYPADEDGEWTTVTYRRQRKKHDSRATPAGAPRRHRPRKKRWHRFPQREVDNIRDKGFAVYIDGGKICWIRCRTCNTCTYPSETNLIPDYKDLIHSRTCDKTKPTS